MGKRKTRVRPVTMPRLRVMLQNAATKASAYTETPALNFLVVLWVNCASRSSSTKRWHRATARGTSRSWPEMCLHRQALL